MIIFRKNFFFFFQSAPQSRIEKPCFFEKAGHVFCREIENHEWWWWARRQVTRWKDRITEAVDLASCFKRKPVREDAARMHLRSTPRGLPINSHVRENGENKTRGCRDVILTKNYDSLSCHFHFSSPFSFFSIVLDLNLLTYWLLRRFVPLNPLIINFATS